MNESPSVDAWWAMQNLRWSFDYCRVLNNSAVTLNESWIIGSAGGRFCGRAGGGAGFTDIPGPFKSSFRSEFLEVDIWIVPVITKMIIATPIQAAHYEYIILFILDKSWFKRELGLKLWIMAHDTTHSYIFSWTLPAISQNSANFLAIQAKGGMSDHGITVHGFRNWKDLIFSTVFDFDHYKINFIKFEALKKIKKWISSSARFQRYILIPLPPGLYQGEEKRFGNPLWLVECFLVINPYLLDNSGHLYLLDIIVSVQKSFMFLIYGYLMDNCQCVELNLSVGDSKHELW